MNLVIVESPTKAKTISRFLPNDFKTESSFGHVRDLPKTKLGIDLEHNFEPTYVIADKARPIVEKIRELAKKAKKIYYATDEDREGEAIAWHIDQILRTKKLSPDTYRVAFHEITKDAVLKAIEQPRMIDLNLVSAQQARRILDRLVGYKLSPFLWQKIARGLSAGRVQSVAVRLIVEREREIKNFKQLEYWSIGGLFQKDETEFKAELIQLDGKKCEKFSITSQQQADDIRQKLERFNYSIFNIETKEKAKTPYPPYKTSTLQQDAFNRLRFSSKETMLIAQQLYEGIDLGTGLTGLITYMRTDAVYLSDKFLVQAQNYLKTHYGEKYSLSKPRLFQNKTKGAQEAHEAIRPTDAALEPDAIKQCLSPKQYKLYTLIWQRALASQMPAAIISNTIVDVIGGTALFRSIGSTLKFDGFLKVYPIKITENELPPNLNKNDALKLLKIINEQHFTEPPPRYNDASLVKELEKRGIGRPSTYAPIIDTIQKRNYVEQDTEKRFFPTEIGELVNKVLEEHFSNIVDYDFTALMEENLDKIADQKQEWTKVLQEFYTPFAKLLAEKEKEVTKQELTEEIINKPCPKCGKNNLTVKIGRFGKFLACPGFPECKYTEPINKTENNGQLNQPSQPTQPAPQCNQCNVPMVLKESRFGKFWACPNYPKCKNTQSITEKINSKCPECSGEIIIRRTKKGKIFYGCSRYPECKYASWKKPEEINQQLDK